MTWLRWLLKEFGVSVTTPTPLLSKGTCAISIVCNPMKHKLIKHIGVYAPFVSVGVHDQIIALISYNAWTRQKLSNPHADTAGHGDTLGHAGICVSHRISRIKN